MNTLNELRTNWLRTINERRSNPKRTPIDPSLFTWSSRNAPPDLATEPDPPSLPVSEWTRRYLNIEPDPVQTQLLDHPAHRLLLNCTRQWGKTTICAAKALHFALHHPSSVTLVAAPTARQSTLFLNKIHTYLRILAIAIAPVPRLERSLLLPNQAQIISLPGRADNIRGFTAHLLVFDEAARIPNALFEALTPALATTNGPLWLLSTPNGPDNLFYDLWHSRTGICQSDPHPHPYTCITVTAIDCPRLTPQFLATQRLMLGEIIFRQEYNCEFLAGPHTMFSLELLQAAIDPTIEPLFDHPLWN